MSDGQRETLTVGQRKRKSRYERRAEMAASDFENLAGNDGFLRFLFTVFQTAGMYTGNFHPDQRTHAFLEGRRSMGFDILRTAESYLGPDAQLRILEAEKKATLGGSNDDRSGTDYTDERDGELGHDRVREHGHGLVYLDYGPERPDGQG